MIKLWFNDNFFQGLILNQENNNLYKIFFGKKKKNNNNKYLGITYLFLN